MYQNVCRRGKSPSHQSRTTVPAHSGALVLLILMASAVGTGGLELVETLHLGALRQDVSLFRHRSGTLCLSWQRLCSLAAWESRSLKPGRYRHPHRALPAPGALVPGRYHHSHRMPRQRWPAALPGASRLHGVTAPSCARFLGQARQPVHQLGHQRLVI